MFDPLVLAVAAWVVLVVAAGTMVIRRWGPGRVKRSVRCPDKNTEAKLVVLYTEPKWGTLTATDVAACSLFGAGPVGCDKACLARL